MVENTRQRLDMKAVSSSKDFETDQEVRWCPGCGDYAILKSVQKVLADLEKKPEQTVFISGIGCSSRFPYYVNSYGFHTIHGRAPTVASGVKIMQPELDVWVITGDGDGLSIGLGHLMHIMRRNIDVTILMINNRIYGLTKGQYSPTSELGKISKSSPSGTQDAPLNPVKIALAAECSFIGRAIDIDSQNLQAVLKAANQHKGCSFVEIYQNCNVFNDGAFADISQRDLRVEKTIQLLPGQPMVFGKNNQKGLAWDGANLKVVEIHNEQDQKHIASYDPHLLPSLLLQLLDDTNELPLPLGVLKATPRTVYQAPNAIKVPSLEDVSKQVQGKASWVIDECST